MSVWEEKWLKGETRWHLENVNKQLLKGFPILISEASPKGKTIFVPFCGKTLDMKFLYDQGLTVVGVEFAEKPIIDFFNEHNISHNIEKKENYDVFISTDGRMKIFRSDLFALDETHYGMKFDYIWDRGALEAVDKTSQLKYAQLIQKLMKEKFSGLLEVFEYDESLLNRSPYPFYREDLEKTFESDVKFEELLRLTSEQADHTLGVGEDTILYKFERN